MMSTCMRLATHLMDRNASCHHLSTVQAAKRNDQVESNANHHEDRRERDQRVEVPGRQFALHPQQLITIQQRSSQSINAHHNPSTAYLLSYGSSSRSINSEHRREGDERVEVLRRQLAQRLITIHQLRSHSRTDLHHDPSTVASLS